VKQKGYQPDDIVAAPPYGRPCHNGGLGQKGQEPVMKGRWLL
jgi:hypothetical protein